MNKLTSPLLTIPLLIFVVTEVAAAADDFLVPVGAAVVFDCDKNATMVDTTNLTFHMNATDFRRRQAQLRKRCWTLLSSRRENLTFPAPCLVFPIKMAWIAPNTDLEPSSHPVLPIQSIGARMGV